MRWLLVGALGVETLPLVAALEGKQLRSPRLVTGRLAGVEVGVLTCGVGPARAESRTEACLAELQLGPGAAVISLGTCGALVDDLSVGDVVSAAVLHREGSPEGAISCLPGPRSVALVTVAEAVWTAERRDQLAAMGAEACEMEAHAVWTVARRRGLGFHALKVVRDRAGGEPLDKALGKVKERNPLVIGRFLARAGRLSHGRLLPAVEAAVITG